jgi:hypothetical protein
MVSKKTTYASILRSVQPGESVVLKATMSSLSGIARKQWGANMVICKTVGDGIRVTRMLPTPVLIINGEYVQFASPKEATKFYVHYRSTLKITYLVAVQKSAAIKGKEC